MKKESRRGKNFDNVEKMLFGFLLFVFCVCMLVMALVDREEVSVCEVLSERHYSLADLSAKELLLGMKGETGVRIIYFEASKEPEIISETGQEVVSYACMQSVRVRTGLRLKLKYIGKELFSDETVRTRDETWIYIPWSWTR